MSNTEYYPHLRDQHRAHTQEVRAERRIKFFTDPELWTRGNEPRFLVNDTRASVKMAIAMALEDGKTWRDTHDLVEWLLKDAPINARERGCLLTLLTLARRAGAKV